MKATAYIRVSTMDQVEHGVSLYDQKSKIQQYCKLYGLEIVKTVSDAGKSAKDLNRDGMKKILTMMREKKVEAVVVAKLDRLTRSVADLSKIIELANKNDIALISISERLDTASAAGRMLVNMLAVISQWERETIGERTKAALRFKKKNGHTYNGQALYGYENKEGALYPVEEEQTVIGLVMGLHRDGKRVAQICRDLRGRGYRTRSGKGNWHSKVVAKIIKDSGARQKIDNAIRKR